MHSSVNDRELVSAALTSDRVATWSLITVAFNSAEALKAHWVLELPSWVEWIVVDNASKDDSVQVATDLGAKVVCLEENVGFARANNFAAKLAQGELLGFVNPDVVPEIADLERLGKELLAWGGIVAPQLINDNGSLQPNGRGEPYLSRKIRNRLFPAESLNGNYRLYAKPGEVLQADWVTGAMLAMSANDFSSIGAWDPDFFLYYEDVEICFRAKSMHYPIRVIGDCRWNHSWAREARGLRWGPWRNEVRSALKFYRRHPKLLIPKW